jgi:hypothetical protein
MILSPLQYNALVSKLRVRYKKELAAVLRGLKKNDAKVASWLSRHASELNNFSPLNWHFVQQLKTFTYFCSKSPLFGKSDFGPEEEELFEKWNNSEFAGDFLRELNKGSYLGKASQKTLRLYDQHLEAFANKHILKINKPSKGYRVQTSLGEIQRGDKITQLLKTTLHFEGKDLDLLTGSLGEMKKISPRIETALKVIKKHSPSSWERFVAFSEVIIPIKEKELVSYSHQDLPGYSMINLYHRDFVDLMDDLLHENGHHHLNYYLNLGKLIDEPVDTIYYSPWRRTLRPLRGIYHAYFTFFWAFKLFADLNKTQDVDSIFYVFNKEQKEKMIWRAVEEFHMLNFTFQDLKWAHKNGLINERGWSLVQEQQKELLKFKKLIPLWEKRLKLYRSELKDLKTTLNKAQFEYLKD